MSKIDYKSFKKPTNFLKLPQGTTPIRIVSEGDMSLRHGKKMGGRFIELGICKGAGCEFCKQDPENEPALTYRWIALDRSSGIVGVLNFGTGAGASLCELIKDNPSPTTYDILITRTGEGKQSRYSVRLSPESKPFTEAEREVITLKKPLLTKKYLLDE